MTLHIDLPAAVETALLAQAAAEGKDVSTLVAEAVAQRLTESAASAPDRSPTSPKASQGFDQRLHAWIELHPRTVTAVDDSRESIYAGRGE